jgi:hypothetical protein
MGECCCGECKNALQCATGSGLFCSHPKVGIFVEKDGTCNLAEKKEATP